MAQQSLQDLKTGLKAGGQKKNELAPPVLSEACALIQAFCAAPLGLNSLFLLTQAFRPGLNNLVPLAGHFVFLAIAQRLKPVYLAPVRHG